MINFTFLLFYFLVKKLRNIFLVNPFADQTFSIKSCEVKSKHLVGTMLRVSLRSLLENMDIKASVTDSYRVKLFIFGGKYQSYSKHRSLGSVYEWTKVASVDFHYSYEPHINLSF